jgi:hypothetical protein
MSSGIVIGEEGDDDDVVFLASASESSELQRVDEEETVRDRNRRSSRAAVGSVRHNHACECSAVMNGRRIEAESVVVL